MRARTRTALVVAAWAVVVVLATGLVWAVIASAGSDLAGDGGALPRPGGDVATGSGAEPRTEPAPATTSSRPRPSRSAPADPTPTSAPTSASPRTSGAPGTPPTGRTATWSGAAGVVTSRCVGASISLVRAVPSADGYRVEVKDTGPGRVDVEFEGRGEDTEDETRVRAECAGGVPRYEVER